MYNSRTVSERSQKHPRINMAFYDDNLAYLQEAAWKARKSVTAYVNDLIAADKEKNNSHPQNCV